MAQKINPISIRLGIIEDWRARWFPKKHNFKNFLEEDMLVRKIINEKIGAAGIDRIILERAGNNYKIFIKASRPGLIIGRGGKGVEDLTKELEKAMLKLRKIKGVSDAGSLSLNIEELKRSEVSASVIAQNIAADLKKRMPFRRMMKKYLENILQSKDVKGAKIRLSGRLDGGEFARTEMLSKGRVPLHTLRTRIDYGEATAFTTYGAVGVKVWVNKGEVFKES